MCSLPRVKPLCDAEYCQQWPKGYPESYPNHPIGDLMAAFIWLSF
jgi:hypothetical protein